MAKEKFFDREFVIPAIVLGAGIFLSATMVSYTLYAIRSLDNTLTVTGSATQEVQADTANWTISVYRSATDATLADAYAHIAKDVDAAQSYFASQGIASGDISKTTVAADQDWSGTKDGGPKMYNVHEEITIESKDVHKVQDLSQNITSLTSLGISVTPQQPQYYVSNLPELRVALLGKAINDARSRADAIASSGGGAVGKLKSAASGVVQVLAPNSTSVDDYGSYDTSTIDKQVMVTARATFLVR